MNYSYCHTIQDIQYNKHTFVINITLFCILILAPLANKISHISINPLSAASIKAVSSFYTIINQQNILYILYKFILYIIHYKYT